MTLKTIIQLSEKCHKLPNIPRSLSLVNAYTDQALMNLTYETMKTDKEVTQAIELITDMITKYRNIMGR